MSEHETSPEEALVPGGDRALTGRSQALVRRALHDLSRPAITPELLDELEHSLFAGDIHASMEAAHTIIRLAPHLSIEDEAVGCLVVRIVKELSRLDHPHHPFVSSLEPHRELDQGKLEDLTDLLTTALQALIGPEASLEDCILEVLERSPACAKTSAVWALLMCYLPKDKARAVLHNVVKQATDQRQALMFRFALAQIFSENVDSVYRDLVQYCLASPADTGQEDYFAPWYLGFLDRYVSSDTAAESFCKLADEGHPDVARGLLSDTVLSSVARSCSQDAWLRMTQTAWSQFLHARSKTHLAHLSPTRNPSEVRALLEEAPHEPYYVPGYPKGRRAHSLKQTRWGRVLALLMDARIPRGES